MEINALITVLEINLHIRYIDLMTSSKGNSIDSEKEIFNWYLSLKQVERKKPRTFMRIETCEIVHSSTEILIYIFNTGISEN